jgi:hypothetical protein
LGRTNIGDAKTVALAAALEKNSTLKYLVLRCTNIGDAGAVALAAALENNLTLKYLDLGCIGVGDAGIVKLAAALEKNSALENLDLGENNIGDAGVVALAKALEKNSTLKSLYFNRYNIRYAAAAALSSIWEILAWNRTSKSSKAQIVAAFYILRPRIPPELIIQVLESAVAPRPGLRFIILETIREFEERQRLADKQRKGPRTTSGGTTLVTTPPTKIRRTRT